MRGPPPPDRQAVDAFALWRAVNAKLFAIRGSFIAIQTFQLDDWLHKGVAPAEMPGFFEGSPRGLLQPNPPV